MRYIKRDLTPKNNQVAVFYEDTGEVLFTCHPFIADSICYTWNNQKKILAGRRMTDTRQEVHTCQVCGANFTDPYAHLEQGGLVHATYIDNVRKSGYSEPCMCGSDVKQYEYMGGGWERACDLCKMVYDSDDKQKRLWEHLEDTGKDTFSGADLSV